jgi:hypothetical protein
MLGQIGLFVITLGIYAVYWFYITAQEMKHYTRKYDTEPVLLTILMFIPLVQIYAMYKYSELYELTSRDQLNRWILFLLWLVFPPAVWFIVQSELNDLATQNKPQIITT